MSRPKVKHRRTSACQKVSARALPVVKPVPLPATAHLKVDARGEFATVAATAGGGPSACPRSNSDECDANPFSCRCAEAPPRAFVTGLRVRTAPVSSDTLTSIACGVAAVMKHVISPVCTWKGTDIDNIGVEGGKLTSDIVGDTMVV